MTPRARTDDLFDFKRIFTLMLALVVLPTLLLSGFGILAIKNERAALEKRLQDTYQERAEKLETALLDRLKRIGPTRNSAEDSTLEPVLEPVLELTQANALLASLVQQLYPDESAQFTLVATDAPERSDRTLYEALRVIASGLPTGVWEDGSAGVRPLIRRPLPAPYQGIVLWAYVKGGDPVAEQLLRNTILYSSLMVLFLALVIFGVVLTARFLYREVQLSRLQTDFVSNISHELRTPLTSIRMFIETLQLGRVQDEAEVKECLSVIALESERLTKLIERILGWARLEAGRRVYHWDEVKVETLLANTLQAFQTQALQARFQLDVSCDEGLPPVWIDQEALSEVLLNLLNNAIKYTGDDKRLAVRAGLNKGQVAISVSDNGIGIRASDRKRIFEKFYRSDVLLSRKTEGSGLGLSIVRHIVDAHGGRVLLESEEGKGSKFTVLLPPSPG